MRDTPDNEKLFGKYQEIALLLLGFALTTFLGGIVGEKFQRRSWDHDHLVQTCESERDARIKGEERISDSMDRRLLRMRQLVWKMQSTNSIDDLKEERKNNSDARDDWSIQLNSNLAFVQTHFGEQSREVLEQQIGGGFRKIQGELNDALKGKRFDKGELEGIEGQIDELNRTIYAFDLSLQAATADAAARCNTIP